MSEHLATNLLCNNHNNCLCVACRKIGVDRGIRHELHPNQQFVYINPL